MVRLKDIAREAGVSVMTVSRVLRGAPDISTATQTRVRAVAQQMGYVPDAAAQGLRNRTSRLFGLILPTLSDPFYARLAAGLTERIQDLGCDLLVAHSLNLVEREEACIRRCLARRVDGLFLVPVCRLAPTAPAYEELRRRRTRAVVLGQKPAFCEDFPNVETDDVAGAALATRHLLELGHRRIAFLTGPAASRAAQERLEGYRRALRAAELELDDRLVFTAGTSMEEGARAAAQMLTETPGATAVQAVSDTVALGALTAFLSGGVRIPQDLSLVGYGGAPLTAHWRIPLTTVHQPKFRLGEKAVEMMLALLRGVAVGSQRLPVELVVRATTAAPGWNSR